MNQPICITFATLILLFTRLTAQAQLDPAAQARVDAAVMDIQQWASNPAIVKAVSAQNATLPADYSAMTQDKWKVATILDPFVRSFSKNEAGAFLKTKKTDTVSEAFISDANGLKVGFLSKTSSWSHKGNPKHEVPMTGKIWQGKVELDESTGLQQVQVSVPVLADGKPAGSLVVGLVLSKLEK
ncbi:MAG TPA: hypothetical protein VGH19_17330 [Verrucomicrobiae bacterium]